MDDDRGPQYWRSIANFGTGVVAVGAVLVILGLLELKQHPPVPAYMETTCAIDNKPVPCSTMFPPSPADIAHEQARQATSGAETLAMFGFLVIFGGGVPVWTAGVNLNRIRYQVMDYTYEQMQSQQGQSQSRAEIPCPSCGQMNDPTNQFCGKCGKPLSTT